jgi:hypothetical protein
MNRLLQLAQLLHLLWFRIATAGLYAERPRRVRMQVDAVAPACAVVPESQRQQQALEVAEGDDSLPLEAQR